MSLDWLQVFPDLDWLRLQLLRDLLLASLLGGVIGLEREVSGKPAGFRTNLLICVGSALLTDLSLNVAAVAEAPMNADPGRIAAQIVSGIGFLGAGTILQSRGSVTGLTTAATLWVVAAIGMSVGAGAYVEAVGTTVLVVIALLALGHVEERFFSPDHRVPGRMVVELGADALEQVQEVIERSGIEIDRLDISRTGDRVDLSFEAHASRERRSGLVRAMLELDGVRRVKSAGSGAKSGAR